MEATYCEHNAYTISLKYKDRDMSQKIHVVLQTYISVYQTLVVLVSQLQILMRTVTLEHLWHVLSTFYYVTL